VIGVSVDSVHAHSAWRRTPRTAGGIGAVPYPLVSDLDKSIARAYGVLLDKPSVALRAVFLIERAGIVRSSMVNDLPLGRNVDEVLRVLDALQLASSTARSARPTWRKGEPAMAPTLEGVVEYVYRTNGAAVAAN
jgi:peroxiredoxin 2/4